MDHDEVYGRITSILDGEDDWIAAMATVACELHNAFDHYNWTGFYRTTSPGMLKIGPYQGGHGCLYIPFEKGICGAAARTGETQDVPNVLSTLPVVQPPTARSWFLSRISKVKLWLFLMWTQMISVLFQNKILTWLNACVHGLAQCTTESHS